MDDSYRHSQVGDPGPDPLLQDFWCQRLFPLLQKHHKLPTKDRSHIILEQKCWHRRHSPAQGGRRQLEAGPRAQEAPGRSEKKNERSERKLP